MRNRNYLILGGLLVLLAGSRIAIGGTYEDAIVAVREDRTDIVVNLLGRGLDPNTADTSGTTLLMVAARNGNVELLDFLLRSGANAMNQNRYGDTAIALAALYGHEHAVQRMIDAGARSDGPGWGALHYAAYGGYTQIVRLLLSSGVNVNTRAPTQQTALMLAARNGHRDVVKLLIDAGACSDMGDLNGNTAQSIALKAGNDEIVSVLRAGANR
jgi:uncharacterized protein